MRAVGNTIPFSRVIIRERPLGKLTRKKNHPVNGLDTETLDGYCKLISDHNGNYILPSSIEEIFDYLTQRQFRSCHNFFYNLRYDMNAIIKYLPTHCLRELWKNGKTKYGSVSISYIPKKLFRLTKSKHVYKFFDLAQFYEITLEQASKEYLGLKKNPDKLVREKIGTDPQYWEDNYIKIIRYCANDADLTKRLGELLQDTLKNKVGLTPQSYISKATLSKEYIRKNADIPSILKVNPKVLRMAFNAYHGGRFEIIKKGNVGECSLIDINSAYPHKIRSLVDVTTGKWKRTRSLHEDAVYGYYITKVMTKYQNICPLAFQHRGLITTFPVHDFITFLTKNELMAYERDIVYDILMGWEYFEDSPTYPFKDVIDNLYKCKQETDEGHYEYLLYKKIMNAIYGSFYEKIKQGTIWKAGKLFNPIYATEITADTRIQCYQEGKKYGNRVVGFATDSVLVEGKIDIPPTKVLGEWAYKTGGNSIVLRSGIYRIGKKLKERGIQKVKELKTPYGKFKDIFAYIEGKPTLEKYPIFIHRPINFVEALLHSKKLTHQDINVFTDMKYEIDINRDYKRRWNDTFKNGGELFTKKVESQPLILG